MTLALILAAAAMVAAVVLLLEGFKDPLRIGALVVAAIQLLIVLGVVRLQIRDLPLGIVLGGALLALGVIIFLRVQAKTSVASATVLSLVGAVQLLGALRLYR